jgi:hypothetical protein
MVALIDWDNLDDRERRQGARYLADKLWTTLGGLVPALLQGVQNFDIRLYGGWYGWNGARNITPLATQLAADVQNDFPFILRDSSDSQSVRVAPALDCHPLHSTYTTPRGAYNDSVVVAVDEKDPPASLRFRLATSNGRRGRSIGFWPLRSLERDTCLTRF